MLGLIRQLGKRALAIGSTPSLAAERVTDSLEVARNIPELRLDDRAADVERFSQDLHASLERFPHGWAGNRSPDATLAERIASVGWYHTIELPDGTVTPGWYDHRPLVPLYGIPDDLEGKRVLDIGPWDGFWSFEFERRGAIVTALDIASLSRVDLPSANRLALKKSGLDQEFGGGFELAREQLNSSVRRVVSNVYDLDPTDIGTFDLVHFSDVLLHLERPTEALRAVRSITGGQLMVVLAFDPSLGHRSLVRYYGGWNSSVVWWIPSMQVAGQWLIDAGFTDLRVVSMYRLNAIGSDAGDWRMVVLAKPG